MCEILLLSQKIQNISTGLIIEVGYGR